MANSLPDQGHGAHLHEIPNKAGQDDGQLRQEVTVDIDAGEQADGGGGRDPDAPIPLPATADGEEALLDGEVKATMLVEADEDQDEGNAEEDSKTNGDATSGGDGVDGRPAPGSGQKGAIGEDVGRGPGVKG